MGRQKPTGIDMERNYVTVTLYIDTLSCAIDSPCRARGNNASVKTGSLHGAEATRRPATGVALCASESRARSEHVVVLVVVAVVRGDVAAVAAAVCDGFLRAISQPHHRTAAAECDTVTPLTPVSSSVAPAAVRSGGGVWKRAH